MMRSLFSAVSGLKANQTAMDVIGNNVANVNTVGYKSSRSVFQDIYSQTVSSATAPTDTTGGINAQQIGLGTSISGVGLNMTQGSTQATTNSLDFAISGEGFLIVKASDGNYYYTRNGALTLDANGNLVTQNGDYVMGVQGGPAEVSNGAPVLDIDGKPLFGKLQIVGVMPARVVASKNLANSGITIALDHAPLGSYTFNITTKLEDDGSYGVYANLTGADSVKLKAGMTSVTFSNGVKVDFTKLTTDSLDPTNKASIPLTAGSGTAAYTSDYSNLAALDDSDILNGDLKLSSSVSGGITTFTAKQTDANGNIHSYTARVNTADLLSATSGASVKTKLNFVDSNNKASFSLDYTTKALGDGGTYADDAEKAATVTNAGHNYEAVFGGSKTDLSASTTSTFTVADGEENYSDYAIDTNGVITATNGEGNIETLGRIVLAMFDNAGGLEKSGSSYYSASANSGDALISFANHGCGKLKSGYLEMSNVDLATELTNMIITQRGYQANSRVITTSDSMLEELINLKRS